MIPVDTLASALDTIKTSPDSAPGEPEPAMKHGQGILARVQALRSDLLLRIKALMNLPSDDPGRARIQVIETALAGLTETLPGTLDDVNVDPVTAARLSNWLEASQFLAEGAPPTAQPYAKPMAKPAMELAPHELPDGTAVHIDEPMKFHELPPTRG